MRMSSLDVTLALIPRNRGNRDTPESLTKHQSVWASTEEISPGISYGDGGKLYLASVTVSVLR